MAVLIPDEKYLVVKYKYFISSHEKHSRPGPLVPSAADGAPFEVWIRVVLICQWNEKKHDYSSFYREEENSTRWISSNLSWKTKSSISSGSVWERKSGSETKQGSQSKIFLKMWSLVVKTNWIGNNGIMQRPRDDFRSLPDFDKLLFKSCLLFF